MNFFMCISANGTVNRNKYKISACGDVLIAFPQAEVFILNCPGEWYSHEVFFCVSAFWFCIAFSILASGTIEILIVLLYHRCRPNGVDCPWQ